MFGPIDWHVHEMLYGYLAAVVAGFLLTAIPNWTGRFPLAGTPLVLLVVLWCAGRAAVLVSSWLGPLVVAAVDCAFLIVFAAVCVREVVAGRNWRNLRVIAVLAVLAVGNILFHGEAWSAGTAAYGGRVGMAAAIVLIMLVGGRIVPSFTHNWLVRDNPGRLPQPFSTFDLVAVGAGILALTLWVLPLPLTAMTGAALAIAGALQAVRLARWAGDRTVRDPLVLILHVGYAFVPFGFLLLAGSTFWPAAVPVSAGVHAFTAGAVGVMTVAVMTRATLGHTGRSLVATPGTQAIYALVVVAALSRIAASMVWPVALLHVAALAWIAAFGGFVLLYGPMLLRPRQR